MVQGYQPNLTLSFCQILALLLTKHVAHSFSVYQGSHSNRVQEQTFSRIILSTTNNEPLSYNDFGEENNGEENGEDEVNEDDEDDEDEDEGEDDAYTQLAPSEFKEDEVETSNGLSLGETLIDWGSEYDKLRDRQEDVNSGKVGPAKTLFRMMQSDNPNVAIGNFVKNANPEVVNVMTSAVTALLGGLSNPLTGMDTIIKTNGEKLGSLCFQLQMTGYMFRNAEYVVAIKDLMKIGESASIDEYKVAFDRLDSDMSGYIESSEIESLLFDVYDGNIPECEIDTFLNFFDSNKDGRISWIEFEEGFGAMTEKIAAERMKSSGNLPSTSSASLTEEEEEEEDGDNDELLVESSITGMVEVELKDGKIIDIEAKEYFIELKKEAEALKQAISDEKSGGKGSALVVPGAAPSNENNGSIVGYVSSLNGDVQSLTKGISPDIVEAMKMLVNYVLDGGIDSSQNVGKDKDKEMEIPGSALQQLALWQLVVGYKLREAEATGEYQKMLD